MAYTASTFAKVAGGQAQSVWIYKSNDALSVIDDSGYFNSAYENLRQGDIILAACDLDGTPAAGILIVTSTDFATTVTTAVLNIGT